MNKKVLLVLALFIIGLCFVVVLSLDEEVDTTLSITKSEIVDNKISIEYDKKYGVENYYIEITSNGEVVYKTTTNNTSLELELENLINGTEYVLYVYANSGNEKLEKYENEYRFVWNHPRFMQNTILLDDKDYTLYVDAAMENSFYSIAIFIDDEQVLKESLTSNEFVIPKSLYEGKEVILDVGLYKSEVRLDEIKLYNRIDPLTDVSISSINEGEHFNLTNILFEIKGGDNADYYNVKISSGKNVVKEFKTTEKVSLLSKNLFELDKSYKIELSAVCGKYSRKSEVNFVIDKLEQISPVYLSNDWHNLKKGSKLSLLCNDEAKILYTLDGTDPLTNGLEYSEPITINEDVTLKTVAVPNDKKKTNSIIKTYDIKIGEKKNLAVYISPSNQYKNIGVEETGYTNEMDEMNDLANYIVKRLEEHGVKVYRNNPVQTITDWLKESKEYKVDLHLAVHSNSSDAHKNYGIETWIYTDSSETLSLASAIQKGLLSIYPYKNRTEYNRGVKYSDGALSEIGENSFNILVEVAHHDDKDDAKWIMEKKREIGENIADSILRYYQVIE